MRIAAEGLVIFSILMGFAFIEVQSRKGARIDHPGTVLVIADDLGSEYLSAFDGGAYARPVTPTLDRLAEEGMVFRHAIMSPVCSATRAMLATGRYAFDTGVGAANAPLAPDEVTYAMNDDRVHGYVGKWHLGDQLGPLHYGWDWAWWRWHNLFQDGEDYYSYTALLNGVTLPYEEYLTTEMVNEAIDFMEVAQDEWVLTLALQTPHYPWHCPPSALAECDPSWPDNEKVIAMVEAMDAELGRLVDALPDGSRVIFLSDNGSVNSMTRDPVMSGKAKHTAWRGGVRTPMIAWGEGVVAGETSELVSAVDIAATLSEGDYHGVSLEPLFSGGSLDRDYVLTEQFGPGAKDTWRAVRGERYKLLIKDGIQVMVDLSESPWETEPCWTDECMLQCEAMTQWVSQLTAEEVPCGISTFTATP